MTMNDLEVENSDFGITGKLDPMDAGTAIYELTNGPVKVNFEQDGEYIDSQEIPEDDANRYIRHMLSPNPDTLEEELEEDVLDNLFYTDERENDNRAQLASTPLPRPDHLDVQEAKVRHAGKTGSSIGYWISFETECDHESYEDDVEVSFKYTEPLSNGTELDQMQEATEIIQDTTLADSTNYL